MENTSTNLQENWNYNAPSENNSKTESKTINKHFKKFIIILLVILTIGLIIFLLKKIFFQTIFSNQVSNTPIIPGANILLVVKNDKGKIVLNPNIHVEVIYENSYFNYDTDFEMPENPYLLYLEPLPSRENTTYQITAEANGLNSKPVKINSRDYLNRLSRNPLYQVAKVIEFFKSVSSVPPKIIPIIFKNLKNAAYLKVITVDSSNSQSKSTDQQYQTNILLYRVLTDLEDGFMLTQWEKLKEKYPNLFAREIEKDELCKIQGNHRCGEYPDETTIMFYNKKFKDRDYFAYLGNSSGEDKSRHNYVSDEGYNEFLNELFKHELTFKNRDKISLLLYINLEDDENEMLRTKFESLKDEYSNLTFEEIGPEERKYIANLYSISTESAIIAYIPNEEQEHGLFYLGINSIYNIEHLFDDYILQGENKFEEFKNTLNELLKSY